MIISHKHKFILLHAGKCAGSSIRHCLNTIIDEPKLKISQNHPNLSYLQETISKSNRNPQEYMVVSIVRNPFDRMVSWYYHALTISKSFIGSFEDFCETRLSAYSDNLIPPYEKCNHVIRYEHLQNDFNTFLKFIGLPPHKLLHVNQNTDRPVCHYSELYTEKSKQITFNYFAKVIDRFSYKFQKK